METRGLDEHLKKLSVNDPNANDADILINEDGEEIINQAKLKITIGQIVKMMKKMKMQLTEVLPPQRRLLKMSVKLLMLVSQIKSLWNCHQLLQFILLVTLQNLISDLPILMMHLGIQF